MKIRQIKRKASCSIQFDEIFCQIKCKSICRIQFDEISVKSNANQFAEFNSRNSRQIKCKSICNIQFDEISVKSNSNQFAALSYFSQELLKSGGFGGKIRLMIGYIFGRIFGIRPKPIFPLSVVHYIISNPYTFVHIRSSFFPKSPWHKSKSGCK